MSGVDPNPNEGLSQEDIDAALAGATGDGAAPEAAPAGAAAPAEPPAAEPQSAPAEASAAAPAAGDAEPPPTEAAAQEPAAAAPDDSTSEGIVGLTQADIDAALGGAQAGEAEAPAAAPEAVKLDSAGRPFDDMAAMMEAAIAEERAAAQVAASSAAPAPAPAPAAPLPPPPPNAIPLSLPEFGTSGGPPSDERGIELLNDVELNVKIELGRAEMLIEEVVRLGEGSVVELDKLAGDPVDVFVNDRLVARGEVIVLNENFCVRISEIVAGLPEEEAA